MKPKTNYLTNYLIEQIKYIFQEFVILIEGDHFKNEKSFSFNEYDMGIKK